ncbi:hypothetical protein G5A92_00495 [Blautia massiliensis]|uniref:CAP domain-containing protein n=1 Tax=Blautia TaxID=572511 RepID=UPI001570A802|nr:MULTISPECIES: CAP domain-containing protein [Blautia]MCC2725185.1 CAP domain-containing protein [Blautia sp. MSK22_86]NSF55550.1 hypothetical protein [Blautia massiliensis (ex Durand et al. 2017)]NSK71203.1 hypothetical protein [Blautia massiliensis (ex Durand et al. 2017)]
MNQTKEKKTRYLLWPALLLLLLLLAPGNIVRVQAASDQTAVQLKLSQGIRRYDYAYQVLDLVNQERAKKNRNPVTMDKNLLECAMTRAEELTVYASHTRPNGSICFSAFPYFEDPSENLAINQGTPEEVMESWIESSGHYANIMNSKNVSAGIGCYSQNGHLYWIQCFSSHAAETCTQPANQNVSPVLSVLPRLVNIHFNVSSPVKFTEEQKTLTIYATCNGFSYMSSSLDPSSFTWSTGDPSVATVDQSGVIRLKSKGNTTVTATLKSCPDKILTADLNAYYDLEDSKETSLTYTGSWKYTGKPITFSPVLKFHNRTLTEGKDYTLSFSNNQNSGVGTFTITGLGLYSGTLTNNFGIWQINLSQAEVTFSQSSYLYTGTPLTPKPTVTWNGITLTENVDYTLSWHNNAQQGNAYVTVSGKGNFTGERNKYFYIDLTPITEAEIGDIPDYEYAPGKEFKPEPTVTLNGVALKKDVDYTLSYFDNTMASSRTNRPRVHITGIGIYRSGFSKYFTINPLKLSGETIELPDTNCGNGSVTTFLRNHLVITYNGVQLTSDDYSITSLRCSAGNEILGFSISYKQNYSGTRQMTSVKRCDLSDIPEQIFSGNAVTPKPTVKYGSATLQEGTDYVLSWADNTKTGTGSVTVTGINKYFASQTLTFKISAPAPTVTPTPKPTNTPAPKPTSTPAPAVVKLTAPTIKASTSWNSCTLRWNRVKNSQNYILYRKTNSGKYAKIKTLNANTTSYKDTKITIGNKYSYVIRASRKTSSGYIYSPTSKAVTVKPNLLRPSTKLKTLKGKQIISWKKVPGATGYVLYQKKGNGSFKKVKTVSARNLNYTFKTSKNATYSYRVVPYRTINRKAKTGPASAVKTGKAR